MVVFTSYVASVVWPIRQLGRILSNAGKSFVAVERIDEILRAPVEPAEPDAIQPSLNGDIVFDHVTFGYDSDRNVLQDMSFTVPAGETVAILGATGSGKSSIVHLMQRFFEPQSGRITIGGVDIQKIERSYLRAHVGLVLQEPFLSSKTLRDNVGIAVCHPFQQAIEHAAVDASALSFIEDSENGWDSVVGERGVTLLGRPEAAHCHCPYPDEGQRYPDLRRFPVRRGYRNRRGHPPCPQGASPRYHRHHHQPSRGDALRRPI
ncbi:MAG: ABC transporter ATP-binding protein [Christensenellales bacterium]